MFAPCTSFIELDLSNFDTSNVKYMGGQGGSGGGMFSGCSSLQFLDISSFNTSNLVFWGSMFKDTPNLKVIYVGPDWTGTSSGNSTDMFTNCGVSEVTLKP